MSSSHHQQPLNLVPCDPSYCIPLLIPALGRFLAVSTAFPVLRTALCRQAGLGSRRFPLPARPPILPSSWLTGDTLTHLTSCPAGYLHTFISACNTAQTMARTASCVLYPARQPRYGALPLPANSHPFPEPSRANTQSSVSCYPR